MLLNPPDDWAGPPAGPVAVNAAANGGQSLASAAV
jgi:hypothetical protein